jgi:hypothetical protein
LFHRISSPVIVLDDQFPIIFHWQSASQFRPSLAGGVEADLLDAFSQGSIPAAALGGGIVAFNDTPGDPARELARRANPKVDRSQCFGAEPA